MTKDTVIIIGAGAAGLMAALELADRYSVIIIEARDRIGGRIHSIQTAHSHIPVEAGAEFIHGNLPLTLQLLKKANINYTKVEGKFYRKEKGQFIEQTEMIEGWKDLLKSMKGLKIDMTMADFLDLHYPRKEHAAFRRHVTGFTEGFDIADINKASVQALYKEWSQEEEDNYRIPQGYSALIDYLEAECTKKRCQIVTNQVVKQIDWEKDHVTIYTDDRQLYYAQKLVVTVPISILRKTMGETSINFSPALDEHIKAANDTGMGEVVKIVLHFAERFWKEDTGFVFSDEIFPTWWTQLPDTSPVLTGWAGGPKAVQLSNYNDDAIVNKALESLATIFEIPIRELKNNLQHSHVFNWQKDVCASAAYSFEMPATKLARRILNTAVENTIWFAGEGVYEGTSPGTVEAALVSGRDIAKRVIASSQQSHLPILDGMGS